MNIACKMVENMHCSTLFVHMHTKNVVLTLICGAKDTTKVFVSTGGGGLSAGGGGGAICGGIFANFARWGYLRGGLSVGGGAICRSFIHTKHALVSLLPHPHKTCTSLSVAPHTQTCASLSDAPSTQNMH